MNSHALTGGTLLLSGAAFAAALLFVRRRQYGRAAMAIALGAFVLRAFASADTSLHYWDERYHALVAKHLAEHPWLPTLFEHPILPYNPANWGSNHVWVHKQPFALWIIALSIRLFGTTVLAVRLPSALFSSLATLLTYGIGKTFFSRRTALLAAFLHAVNGFCIILAAGLLPTDHVDTLFFFAIELGIFCAVRAYRRPTIGRALLTGLAVGTAVLTKYLPALIVYPTWAALSFRRVAPRRWLVLATMALLVTTAVFLPWQIFIHFAYPTESAIEARYNWLHLTQAVEGHTGGLLYHVHNIGLHYGKLMYVALAWFLVRSVRRLKHPPTLALLTWIVVPHLFFGLVATKMPSYPEFVGPALLLVEAHFITAMVVALRRRLRLARPVVTAGAVALVVAAVLPGAVLVGRYTHHDRDRPDIRAMHDLAAKLSDEHDVVFNVREYLSFMFFSDATAYPFVPTQEQVERARSQGYKVYVVVGPAGIPDLSGVTPLACPEIARR